MAELNDSPTLNANSSTSVDALMAAVMSRIKLPQFLSVSGSATSIKIDEIRLGNATVDRVDIEDVRTQVDTGTVTMENARAIVRLRLRFRFRIRIPLPWPFDDIDIGDSIPIGSFDFPFDIGDISIPALNDIDLVIPTATLEDLQASLEPVNGLDLGGGAFRGLTLNDTILPSAGFTLGGLSLGAFTLRNLTMPSVSSARLSIDGFSPDNPLFLPSIRVSDIELPSTSAPQARSDGPVVVPNISSSTQRIPLTGGFLETSIDISPTLSIAISSMVLNNISAVSTIRNIDLRDLRSTAEVSGVTVDGLELNDVELERVTTTM